MLSRAAESIGLHYRPPPSPERSRLDDWFLGAQAERRQPPPVPRLPSRACKFSSALTAKAYGAAGLRSPSLANSSEEGFPFLERGHPLAPTSRLVESPSMVPGWDAEATSSGSKHYHFCQSPVYKTRLQAEVEPVRRLVFSPPGRPPWMPDRSRALFPARWVGAKAVSLHPQSVCRTLWGCCRTSRYSRL